MNAVERVKMVKAMEFLARQINDEEAFYPWLAIGVADGDIEYGDLDVMNEDFENLDYYLDDNNFRELMGAFLRRMKVACKDGLCCNGIVGTEKD